MMRLITMELFALIGATFLYVYIVRHGLGRAYRIFAGLIILGCLTLLICTHFCKGCGGCGDRSACGGKEMCAGHGGGASCGMGHGEGKSCHMGGDAHGCPAMSACMKKGEGCGHGGGMQGHGCHMMGDSMIEKEVIIKNGDTTVTEHHK